MISRKFNTDETNSRKRLIFYLNETVTDFVPSLSLKELLEYIHQE